MQSTEVSTLVGSVRRFQDLRPVVRCAREMPPQYAVLDAAREGEDVRQRLRVAEGTRRGNWARQLAIALPCPYD